MAREEKVARPLIGFLNPASSEGFAPRSLSLRSTRGSSTAVM